MVAGCCRHPGAPIHIASIRARAFRGVSKQNVPGVETETPVVTKAAIGETLPAVVAMMPNEQAHLCCCSFLLRQESNRMVLSLEVPVDDVTHSKSVLRPTLKTQIGTIQ